MSAHSPLVTSNRNCLLWCSVCAGAVVHFDLEIAAVVLQGENYCGYQNWPPRFPAVRSAAGGQNAGECPERPLRDAPAVAVGRLGLRCGAGHVGGREPRREHLRDSHPLATMPGRVRLTAAMRSPTVDAYGVRTDGGGTGQGATG